MRTLTNNLMRRAYAWLFVLIVLVILTSCNPYQGLAAPTVSMETPAGLTATQTAIPRSPTPTLPRAERCTVRTGVPAGYLNLRTGAGTRYAVIRILDEGEVLKVIRRAAWLQVIDPSGARGYVNRRYCQ